MANKDHSLRLSPFVLSLALLALSVGLLSQTTKPAAGAAPKKPAGQTGGGLAASMARGKKVYATQCLTCHQVDALGVPNMTPPLVKTKWVLGDKTILVQVVLKGLSGEIEIDGDTYHNVMAPHGELSDSEIADVLTYIRNSFGNKAKAVTPAEVAAIRAKTK